MEEIRYMSPLELKKLINSKSDFQLVDIREKYELEIEGKVNSLHIPMGELIERLNEISENKKVIFYCGSGNRSSNILNFMLMNDLYKNNYYSLEGGFRALSEV